MTHIPSISVIIPVYNAENFLTETIESVLCQSFEDFELLLLDDESTDKSSEIIRSYDDKRLRYFHCKHDFIKTRNKGLQLARGKYLAQLDHDDLMMPDRLLTQFEFMESHTDIAACGGYMECFGKYSGIWKIPLEPEALLPYTIIHTPILNPTAFIRREVLTKHKIRHRRGYSFAEDFKFWTDIIKVGKIANIPMVLVRYRTSEHQASIKYRNESVEASYRIQYDMINFFLSRIAKDSHNGKKVMRRWVPAIRDMSESGYISASVYFNFIHEIIIGLINDNIINIVTL